jgi:hypothetical protein
MKKTMLAVAVLAGTLVAAAPASAQLRTVQFGVSGGPAFPVGHLADDVNTGWHAQGSLSFAPIMLPVGIRADILYVSFPEAEDDSRASTLSGNVNAVIGLGGIGFRPYVIAGLGVYNSRGEDIDGETTEVGVNAGGGIEFGLAGLSAFLEARYHHGFDAGEHVRFVPVSIGIRF